MTEVIGALLGVIVGFGLGLVEKKCERRRLRKGVGLLFALEIEDIRRAFRGSRTQLLPDVAEDGEDIFTQTVPRFLTTTYREYQHRVFELFDAQTARAIINVYREAERWKEIEPANVRAIVVDAATSALAKLPQLEAENPPA
jgi:hypothetical protein